MRTHREANTALCVCTVGTLAMLLGGRGLDPNQLFVLLLLSYGGLWLYLRAAERTPGIQAVPVLAAAGLLLVVAAARPPLESDDVFAYASYGRMVAHYQQSPWTHVPNDYPDDPYTDDVDPRWRDTPSAYGPAFVVPAAVVLAIAGDDRTVARVGFQVLALLSVAGALWLVGRETDWAPGPLALLGINPLVILGVVNSGHNDALSAVALLGAVIVAQRERWAVAGALVALAAMVKITALLALIGLVVWAWRRAGHRAALTVAGATGALAGLGLLVAGGPSTVRGITHNSALVTEASVWSLAGDHLPEALVATLGGLIVVGLGALLVLSRDGAARPALLVALGLTSYYLLATYMWHWYLVWGLIPLALCWRSRLTSLFLAVGMLLQLTGAPITRRIPYVAPGWHEPVRLARLLEDLLPYVWLTMAAGLVVHTVLLGRSRRVTGRTRARRPVALGPLAARGERPS